MRELMFPLGSNGLSWDLALHDFFSNIFPGWMDVGIGWMKF